MFVFKSVQIIFLLTLVCLYGPGSANGCTVTCGGGVYHAQYELRSGSQKCPKKRIETSNVRCNEKQCPQDCVLTEWSAWSACSKRCDRGHQSKYRQVQQPALYGGNCPGDLVRKRSCFRRRCERRGHSFYVLDNVDQNQLQSM